MSTLLRASPLVALLMLGACTTIPTGPSIMAMPGTGKSFDQFRADDADCRQFALGQVGGATANEALVDSGVKSAAVGAGVGALAGAALGGHSGAGVGAGVGLLAGSAAGAGAGQASGYGTQRRYDNAYIQCMYAKGERVPVSGQMAPARAYNSQPAASYTPPPPPPGYAPPPSPSIPNPSYPPGPVMSAPAPAPAPPGQQSWYYCSNPPGYYPTVPECRSGWQQVPASAPPGAAR